MLLLLCFNVERYPCAAVCYRLQSVEYRLFQTQPIFLMWNGFLLLFPRLLVCAYADPIQNLSIEVENGNYSETFVYVQQFFYWCFYFFSSLGHSIYSVYHRILIRFGCRTVILTILTNTLNYISEEGHKTEKNVPSFSIQRNNWKEVLETRNYKVK